MNISNLKAVVTGLALVVSVSLPSLAGGTPVDFVKSEQGQLSVLLKKPDTPALRQAVDTVFDRILDYDRLARDSLEKHWEERTEAERHDFKGVLKRLVRNAYRKNLKKTLDYEVSYQGMSPVSEGQLVRTLAKSRVDAREQPISIDYVVHEVGEGRWLIHNIVTEGASLVRSYRNQFGRIIKKEGFEALLRRMKKKLDSDGG